MHLAVVSALALLAASLGAVAAPAGAAEPGVVAVSPAQGPATGGTAVVISGTGLAATTAVHFGTLAAPWLRVDPSGASVTAVSPAQPEGTVVDVTVSATPGELPLVASSPFTYGPVPAGSSLNLRALVPSSGPPAGGTEVTIAGHGLFSATTSVRFGDAIAELRWVADTTVVALAPPHGPGYVRVTVSTDRPTAEAPLSFLYSDGAPGTWAEAVPLSKCTPPSQWCGAHTNPGGPPDYGSPGTVSVLLDPEICHRDRLPTAYPCGHVLAVGGGGGGHLKVMPGQLRTSHQGISQAGSTLYRSADLAPAFHQHDVGRYVEGDNIAPATIIEAVSDCAASACASVTLSSPATASGSGLEVSVAITGAVIVEGQFRLRSVPAGFARRDIGQGVATPSNDPTHPHTPPSGDQRRVLDSGTRIVAVEECADDDHCAVAVLSAPALLSRVGITLTVSAGPAQLYDPSTGTWRATGSMTAERGAWFTATLLDGANCGPSCGRVLVVGGCCSWQCPGCDSPALSSAELYDPVTGIWSPTSDTSSGAVTSMTTARRGHTATVLAEGRVLVAGGVGDSGAIQVWASAEVFDPASGRWTSVGAMPTPRYHAGAVLVSGPASVCGRNCNKVLVVGGAGHFPPKPETFLEAPLTQAELFDPATGAWEATAPSAVRRYRPTATLITTAPCGEVCGKVVVAGGFNNRDDQVEAEIYDPRTERWSQAGGIGMNTPRSGHTATVLASGQVLVAGGSDTDAAAEVFDPATDAWVPTGAYTAGSGRREAEAVLLDGPACRSSPPAEFCGSVLTAGGTRTRTAYDARTTKDSPFVRTTSPRFAPGDVGVSIRADDVFQEPSVIVEVIDASTVRISSGALADSQGLAFSVTAPTDLAERYTPSARIDAVSPGDGLQAGREVTLTGVGFAGTTAVRFAGLAATDVVVHSTTRLTATAPAHAAGVVDVVVTNPGGDSARSSAARFTYLASGSGAASVDPAPAPSPRCLPLPAPAPGQVAYPAGYSLVGLPAGTSLPTSSPRYAWTNQGAGGRYAILAPDQRLDQGQGAWAYFSCPALVNLAAPGVTAPLRLALGAYRASMVANPTAAPAPVSGFDYAARFDPGLNSGRGGYRISAYGQAQTLAAGEAIWVFSFTDTTVVIGTEPPAPTPTRPGSVRRRG